MQGLVHGGLEVPVRRLAVAVLMRLADVDPLAGEAVMFQEPSIAGLKLAFGREVVDRRTQAVAAMPSWNSSEFPQRVLEEVSRIQAFVIPAEDQRGDDSLADELRGWCKERLRRYEYPHLVEFVDELPRTVTGKVQRFKLRPREAAR